jgi:nitroreductase
MNETLKTIMERYSCRDFTGTPLDGSQIKALVEAALASPSGMNRQPWHIIVITDKSLIDELDDEGMKVLSAADDRSSYERIMSRGGKLFYNAPCMFIAVTSKLNPALMDCGILSENIALAAHSLGLGNVICGMANIPLSGPRSDDFKKRLKFPKDCDFGIAVLIGTAKSTKAPHEPDMTKVTYIEP